MDVSTFLSEQMQLADEAWLEAICFVGGTRHTSLHLMCPDEHGKYFFVDGPVELAPGIYELNFFIDGEVKMYRELALIDNAWTITSFWPTPIESEPGQPVPGVRVYDRPREVLERDPGAVL